MTEKPARSNGVQSGRHKNGEIPPIPFVDCEEHGRQLGYCVCKHVLQGAKVASVDYPTEEMIGAISCDQPEHKVEDCVLMCEAHCIAVGLIPRPARA